MCPFVCVRTARGAAEAWDEVTDDLIRRPGAKCKVNLQEFEAPTDYHLGFLWNSARRSLTNARDIWQLNGATQGPSNTCAGNLRPSRHARVQPGSDTGLNFHIISIHLDSGTALHDLEHLRVAMSRLGKTVAGFVIQDADVIIMGMRTPWVPGRRVGDHQLQQFTQRTASGAPRFSDFPVSPQCTEYFQGEARWLHHSLATSAVTEAEPRRGHVSDHCALVCCALVSGNMAAAPERLWHHCPVVLELANRDEDLSDSSALGGVRSEAQGPRALDRPDALPPVPPLPRPGRPDRERSVPGVRRMLSGVECTSADPDHIGVTHINPDPEVLFRLPYSLR